MNKIVIFCLSVIFIFIFSQFCLSEESLEQTVYEETSEIMESDPHLVFKKSVVMKDYNKGQVYTEAHTVKRGDHLWKILRDRYKIEDSKISFFCKVAKFINPDIKDVNKLYPDQDIMIPYKFLKDKDSNKLIDKTAESDAVYVVQPGDHLAKILREKYELMSPAIFSEKTRRLFKKSNPEIKDINKLVKGQKIVIPSEVLALRERFVPIGMLEVKKTEKEESTDKTRDIKEPQVVEPDLTDDELSDNESITKDMLSLLTRSFDGTDNRTGVEEFEVEGSNALKLDYSKYPLYEFPWGKKVLLDYGNRIPGGVKDVITSKWENAEIVGVREKDDIESILDRVLEVCGLFKVEKGGEYTVNKDNIQVSVSGSWIVFKDETLKNVFVVNLIKNSKEQVSPSLKSYLSDLGLTFVDIKSGEIKTTESTAAAKIPDYRKVSAEPLFMTDMVLDVLGIIYKKEQSTNIFQNSDSGFSLEVIADRMFEKDGRVHMIDFQSLPLRLYDVITEQGFKILNISPDEDLLRVAEKILVFCDADYMPSPAEFKYGKSEKSKLRLKVPGILIRSGSSDLLLTQVLLKQPIVQFLADIDVEIIKY